MRYVIALALLVLVALAFSPDGDAGVVCETDNDGAGDCTTGDNCAFVPNGPLAQAPGSPQCDAQEDGDLDGYGNPCDTDVNNDGATGLDDVGLVFAKSVAVSTDPVFDFNCDGATGLDDLGRAFADSIGVAQPGPSLYSCAGSIPCP